MSYDLNKHGTLVKNWICVYTSLSAKVIEAFDDFKTIYFYEIKVGKSTNVKYQA